MKEIRMKTAASDVYTQLEKEAKGRGISAMAVLTEKAKAQGVRLVEMFDRLMAKSGVTVRLVESRRAPLALSEAFERLGHDEKSAQVAAAGRTGRLREASTAKDAAGLGPDAYAYAPDPEDSTTWLLQIAKADPSSEDGGTAFDQTLVQFAVDHLPGIAAYGTAVAIPDKDLDAVKAKLRSAWVACGLSINDLPIEMQNLELAASMRRLGVMSTVGLRAALRGRSGRR